MIKKIALIPGDGIGPEVVTQAVKVLNKVADKYGYTIEYEEALLGCCALDSEGVPLPQKTIDISKASDAILMGAIGGPVSGSKYDDLPGHLRPEAGLLAIRKELKVFANLRPAILFPQLKAASPLKESLLKDGLDIMVVRELTGGIYFGKRGRDDKGAYDTLYYSDEEVKRVAKVAFDIAMKRGKKVMSVDKANVLESSRYWRTSIIEAAEAYPEIELDHMYVDNAAMQLVRNPSQFDVIVTGNMFGDILSDEASMLTGSLGMLPSASLGVDTPGLFEPVHGSAPDIAGQDRANPIAAIMSAAMMLKYSFGWEDAAKDIEHAVAHALDMGCRTGDIYSQGMKMMTTTEMGDLIAQMV